MSTSIRKNFARAALLGAALCLAAPAAFAAKLGPYFPLPNNLSYTGPSRDALLKIEATWLENGIDNLKKARAKAEQELEKAKAAGKGDEAEAALKKFDADIEATTEELKIATDTSPEKTVQRERKRLMLLSLNQWINELNHLATEQMKIAIMKDGAEAQTAEHLNYQYSQRADDLEKAKSDPSFVNWGN
jgi:hypothetical protein